MVVNQGLSNASLALELTYHKLETVRKKLLAYVKHTKVRGTPTDNSAQSAAVEVLGGIGLDLPKGKLALLLDHAVELKK